MAELHADFRAGSTTSMPIAGMICQGLLGLASTALSARMVDTLALYIMAGIFPLAALPYLVVLGMASLAGVIWIPCAWAADDRAGMIHAVGQAIGCYVAFATVPGAYRPAAVQAVVVASYAYTLRFMRRVG
jgi:hypothetical protein